MKRCKFAVTVTLVFVLIGVVDANAQNANVNQAKKQLQILYKSTIQSGKSIDIGDKAATSKFFSAELVELFYAENGVMKISDVITEGKYSLKEALQ